MTQDRLNRQARLKTRLSRNTAFELSDHHSVEAERLQRLVITHTQEIDRDQRAGWVANWPVATFVMAPDRVTMHAPINDAAKLRVFAVMMLQAAAELDGDVVSGEFDAQAALDALNKRRGGRD